MMRTGLRSLASQAPNPKKEHSSEPHQAVTSLLLVSLFGAGTAVAMMEPRRSQTTATMSIKADDDIFDQLPVKNFQSNDPSPVPPIELPKEAKEFLHTSQKYLECRKKMDYKYKEVDTSESLSNFTFPQFPIAEHESTTTDGPKRMPQLSPVTLPRYSSS